MKLKNEKILIGSKCSKFWFFFSCFIKDSHMHTYAHTHPHTYIYTIFFPLDNFSTFSLWVKSHKYPHRYFFASEIAFHLAKTKPMIHCSLEHSRPKSTSCLLWLTFLQAKSDLHDSAALRFIMLWEGRFGGGVKEHKGKLSWKLWLVTEVKINHNQ